MLFNTLDVNKDGFVDFKDLKAYFSLVGIVPSDSKILVILRIMDINDDGVVSEYEFNHFIRILSGRGVIKDGNTRLRGERVSSEMSTIKRNLSPGIDLKKSSIRE